MSPTRTQGDPEVTNQPDARYGVCVTWKAPTNPIVHQLTQAGIMTDAELQEMRLGLAEAVWALLVKAPEVTTRSFTADPSGVTFVVDAESMEAAKTVIDALWLEGANTYLTTMLGDLLAELDA